MASHHQTLFAKLISRPMAADCAAERLQKLRSERRVRGQCLDLQQIDVGLNRILRNEDRLVHSIRCENMRKDLLSKTNWW